MPPHWIEKDNVLERTFTFSNFQEALAFVNAVGEIAETLGHHPDIAIRNYKTVTVSTTTHDEGNTITDKDRGLAKAVDQL